MCGEYALLTEHHVISTSWGSNDRPSNKYYICRSCHYNADKRTFMNGILSTGEDIRNIRHTDPRIYDPNKFLRETAQFFK